MSRAWIPAIACAGAFMAGAVVAQADNLPLPLSVVADAGLSRLQVEEMSLAARRYYAFWNTGDERFARSALSPAFVDRNLPEGRPQGPEGPLAASRLFRAAVPDLRMDVEEMLLVNDRVVGRLRFRGHFTGTFGKGSGARQGDGRAIDFVAVDIYRIDRGQIAENWHLEDNLTLLRQLGAVAP